MHLSNKLMTLRLSGSNKYRVDAYDQEHVLLEPKKCYLTLTENMLNGNFLFCLKKLLLLSPKID